MIGLHEFVATLEDAIAHTHRRRDVALTLHVPGGRLALAGHIWQGRPVASEPDEPPTYGFSKRQCEEIRDFILASAEGDARAEVATPDTVLDQGAHYTGEDMP